MGTWFVELAGKDYDLRRIVSLSQPPAWRVSERDGVYVLESEEFAGHSDATEVRDHARDHLLPMINGLARLAFGQMLSGRIDIGTGIAFDDEQSRTITRIIPSSVAIAVAATVTTSATVIGADASQSPPAPAPPTMAEVCTALRHDPDLFRARLLYLLQGVACQPV